MWMLSGRWNFLSGKKHGDIGLVWWVGWKKHMIVVLSSYVFLVGVRCFISVFMWLLVEGSIVFAGTGGPFIEVY